jgi:hypothetical protein
MMHRLLLLPLLCATALSAAEPAPAYRTDGSADKKLPWYALQPGVFPPEGSAHAIRGELIHVDHLKRRIHLRVDRDDSQDRGVWDLPLEADLLPYASIRYHGALADLKDVPLGTHLHGLFYWRAADDKTPPPAAPNDRKTPDVDFRRCLLLEDDFSHHSQQQQLWRVDAVDLPALKLTATLLEKGEPQGKAQVFDLQASTLIWEGRSLVEPTALKPGQTLLINLTWATLYGPGRVRELWIDEPSRRLATAQQLARHQDHIRLRGLPGWVDAVNDAEQTVTLTLFSNVDTSLFPELGHTQPGPVPAGQTYSGGLAVALETLLMYDPVNDRKGARILSCQKVPQLPGSSGLQLTLKCDMMLEGYRPHRILRYFPGQWKVIALPREEEWFGRE